MARKKKSILSFFEPDVEDCDIGKDTVSKEPLDDCEGVPTGKKGNAKREDTPAPLDIMRSQNEALHRELEALEKTLAELQNERESLKHEVSNLRLQVMKAQLRESTEAESVERYRTAGLPARRVKRIPSKSILFKGQKRKPL